MSKCRRRTLENRSLISVKIARTKTLRYDHDRRRSSIISRIGFASFVRTTIKKKKHFNEKNQQINQKYLGFKSCTERKVRFSPIGSLFQHVDEPRYPQNTIDSKTCCA